MDVIYFRNYDCSPRKAVMEAISHQDAILDFCTRTTTTAIHITKAKKDVQIIGIEHSKNMLKVAKRKVCQNQIHNITLYQIDAIQSLCY